jgi:hypothetical protein
LRGWATVDSSAGAYACDTPNTLDMGVCNQAIQVPHNCSDEFCAYHACN